MTTFNDIAAEGAAAFFTGLRKNPYLPNSSGFDAWRAGWINSAFSENGIALINSYGGGTNSTAVLCGMAERGIVPHLSLFADTGDERPEVYDHLEIMQEWCRVMGFPPIIIVRNELPQGLIDGSLYGECLRLGTMPSKTFGYSTCSMKWKVQPQIKYLNEWRQNNNNMPFVHHVIGYDADEIARSEKPIPFRDWEKNRYLLIEWGWGRQECVDAIARFGLPQPGKSACFMCPSSKKHEVVWLKENHPNLYTRAIELERRALAGEGQAPVARVAGLGRHWNWATFAGTDVATPEVDCGCYDGE